MRILVVDDNCEFTTAIAGILKGEGYEVEQSTTCREALEKIRKGFRPHALILDLGLPDKSGDTIIAENTVIHGKPLQSMPTIMITGAHDFPVNLPSGVRTLRKPFEIEALLGMLDDIKTDKQSCETPPN